MSIEVQPLVSATWLAEKLGQAKNANDDPALRVLEVTINPYSTPSGAEIYGKSHIPGSFHFAIQECRDKGTPFNYTVPSADVFSDYVARLGISNETHVVIYDNDPHFKVKTVGRVWWMFRYFGHDKVSVLDGGLKAWAKEGYEVTSGVTDEPQKATFVATPRPHLLKTFQDFTKDIQTGKTQVLDSRIPQWFDGSEPGLWPGMELGTINSAVYLPFTEFLENGSTQFKSPAEIQSLFSSKGFDLTQPLTTTCNVGVTACMAAFAAYLAGKKDVAMFDGSWDEFSVKGPADMKEFNYYKG